MKNDNDNKILTIDWSKPISKERIESDIMRVMNHVMQPKTTTEVELLEQD